MSTMWKAEWDFVWEHLPRLLKARPSYSSGPPWGDEIKKVTLCAFKDLSVSLNIDVSG